MKAPSLRLVARSALQGAAAAAFISFLVAALEARWAAQANQARFASLWLATAGLLAPLALAMGAGLGLLRPAFIGRKRWHRLRSWFSDAPSPERPLAALLAPFALLLWLVVVANWGLQVLLAEPAPPITGSTLALGSTILGATLVFSVAGFAKSASERPLRLPAPWLGFLVSAVVALTLLLVLVLLGEPSGSGGPLALFGVLRREELDLRPVFLLLLFVVGAVVGSAVRLDRALLMATLVLGLQLGLGFRAARGGLDEPTLALAIERSAPLSSRLLVALQRSSDRDGDGFAALFGGGDCDEDDPRRNPNANDMPANGVDEDCSGADAAVAEPPAAADAATSAPPQHPPGRLAAPLNVVLITVDTLRYDLGYLGYPKTISPRIDELAAESSVFERAYALASYTAKSLPPMMIGKYGGETERGFSHFNRFATSETFLPQRLQRAGVRTVSVQGHWYFFKPFGLERGYDVLNTDAAPKAAQGEGDRGSTSEALSNATITELSRLEQGDKPFFLWAHYTDPHSEYVRHDGFEFGPGSRGAYDSEVAFVDHHVGRVLDALRKGPHWNRTAVILTSDHGEAFGEHGMIRHGFELWEELVRVPLLVRVPGLPAQRIQQRRSVIDVAPTVLELMRVPLPSGQGVDFVSGQSLLLELTAKSGSPLATRPVFIDMSAGPHNAERRAYIHDDLKLVTSAGRPLGLYDLAADPAEKHNLMSDPSRLQPAMERFKAFRRKLREVVVRAP